MAFNPFLSMNEPAAPVTADILNPFMMADPDTETFTGDNPFATSNPFSDFGGGFEPVAGDTVPVNIFGGPDPPGGGARHFDALETAAALPSVPASDIFGITPPVKPTALELDGVTRPPLPAHPLPPETQNLILSVTGQMEFTSTHLLDRIPPTRTPSPVSARDIHSPSLTPEPDIDLPEDMVPAAAPAPAPASVPAPQLQSATDSFDINRNKPVRPPPARPAAPPVAARPPPRPVPPPVPAPVKATQQDDINLFDAPAAPVIKPTNEAILSLYSAPKKEEEKQIDFLSDDIPEVVPETTSTAVPISTPSKADSSALSFASPIESKVETVLAPNPSHEAVAPMDCSEPTVGSDVNMSADNSPFAVSTDEESFQVVKPTETEINPFESYGDTTISAIHTTTNIFAAEDSFMAPCGETYLTNQTENYSGVTTDVQLQDHQGNIFNTNEADAFSAAPSAGTEPAAAWGEPHEPMVQDAFPESQDAFDAFSAKFDSTTSNHMNTGAWGDEGGAKEGVGAFGVEDDACFESEAFDPFLSMGAPPPPAATPRLRSQGSHDSNDGEDSFSVFIRPKESGGEEATVPALAPPPRPQALPESPRVNPFDTSGAPDGQLRFEQQQVDAPRRSSAGSGGETPPTPLFDEDVSQPLEDFPRTKYSGPGWEMHLRQPNKKKITGQRFWKKIFVRVVYQGDNPVVQLLNSATDKEPFQELPLQACYSVSEVGAQQFDQFGKIFTVKLQYIFYKERPGVRPGQVTKAERITNKLTQFAAYAIQGDYQGVKEFGSDLRKLGLPVEHAPQVSQLFKLGSLAYEDVKQFSTCIEEALFRLPAHRDRALTYKMEEVQITAVDELYVEQDAEGCVLKQIARVRLFFLGFLSGMPDVELGVNDLRRQGKEVVGRHDIIPVVTEEWIRVEDTEFHACVQPEEFTATKIIKFKPPDACYIELMRFRVRPPKNRELPLQLKACWCVTGNKVELRADVLVPGFASRKLGQVPCEDVAIRFPIPESWIYLFRVEKHFRYGSVKSAHRRTGKIKGIERFLGAVDTLQESLIEVTSGQAKYEHQHRAIVWRMPRLPKEGQGAYTTHNLVSRMALTSYDQIPAELARYAFVEFTMPATQVSHMTVRSVSLQNHDNDPPEKYVRYLARHEYIVGIERTSGQSAPAYSVAVQAQREAPAAAPAPAPPVPQPPSSDSDSD